MQYVFILLSVAMFIGIIFSSQYKKLYWTIFGIVFLDNGVHIINILIPITRLCIIALICSIILDRIKGKSIQFKLRPYIICVIISSIIFSTLCLIDYRYGFLKNSKRALSYVIDQFSILLLAGCYIKKDTDAIKIFKFFYYCMLICAIYSIYVLFTLNNPYSDLISTTYETNNISDHFINRPRTAISSFIVQPHKNAVFMGLAILIRFYLWSSETINWKFNIFQVISLLVIIFSQLISNSRIASWGLVLAFVIFFLGYFFQKKRKFLFIIISIIYLGLIQIVVGTDLKVLNKVIDNKSLITENHLEEVKEQKREDIAQYGSTISMRILQLEKSYDLVKSNLWIGNGYRWLKEDFGFDPTTKSFTMDGGFYGFESMGYIILIEFGLCGIFAYIIFFGGLIWYNLKQFLKRDRFSFWALSNLSIVFYLIFVIIFNGDPGIFIISLFLISINTAILSNNTDVYKTPINK